MSDNVEPDSFGKPTAPHNKAPPQNTSSTPAAHQPEPTVKPIPGTGKSTSGKPPPTMTRTDHSATIQKIGLKQTKGKKTA